MDEPLHVGVAGAGSIGCFVGGLLAARGDAQVTLLGRARLEREVAQFGLCLEAMGAPVGQIPSGRAQIVTEPQGLAACAVVLVCVKSGQTAELAASLAPLLRPDAVLVSLQNGVSNPGLLRAALGSRRIVPGLVEFNVVSRGEGRFERTTDGAIALESPQTEAERALAACFVKAGLPVHHHEDLAPQQWSKLLINLNNAISALSGAPTRALLLSPGYRRCIAAVLDEAIGVLRAAGVKPALLRGAPVGLMPTVLRLPTFLAKRVLAAQIKVGADSRSSMWEDLTRGRRTEVEFLNGEILRLARASGRPALLNARLVELIHAAEDAGAGSPSLSPEQLERALTDA